MSHTFAEARDAILGVFRTAWNANTTAVAGYVPYVEWEGVKQTDTRDPTLAWARPVIRHAEGGQRTLGGPGTRRYGRTGLVIIQIFVPLGSGLSLSDGLAKVAADAFDGTAVGELWFRNVRPNEIGPDENWYQTNVLAEFDYDEVK